MAVGGVAAQWAGHSDFVIKRLRASCSHPQVSIIQQYNCAWEGNRRSGITVAMHYRPVVHPPAGSRPVEGSWTLHLRSSGVWHPFASGTARMALSGRGPFRASYVTSKNKLHNYLLC